MFRKASKVFVLTGILMLTFWSETPNTSFAMTESQKCSWVALPTCAIIGLPTTWVGGLVCGTIFTYVCNHLPFAPTDKWLRPTCH
jgi:hypothetical protein